MCQSNIADNNVSTRMTNWIDLTICFIKYVKMSLFVALYEVSKVELLLK